MSLSLSVEFQQNFYKALESNVELKLLVGNVYQTVKASTKYPYILQRVNSIKILQTSYPNIYEIRGEINIYIRDSSYTNYSKIINKIEQIFITNNELLSSYIFISGKITEAEFIPSQDMLTTKIKLDYEVLIQDGEYDK